MDEKIFELLYGDMEIREREGKVLTPGERVSACISPLLSWYEKNGRTLPWRESHTPYHVWISEIMLQQTRVTAVIGYYKRFLEVLPGIEDLARVDEEQLLKLWEGLGYYNRAKNLKKAALVAVEQYGGELPASYEELLNLPGIGSYTAGAVASIAYGIPVPAVDGNVLRVVSRILASTEDILKQSTKKRMEALLLSVIPRKRPGAFNQALMEIGAMICIPNGEPRCSVCPIKGICLANRYGKTDRIPVRTPKKKRKIQKRTVLLVTCADEILIRRRPEHGLLAGLYEFPGEEGALGESAALDYLGIAGKEMLLLEKLPGSKHIFTHVEWHMDGYYIKIQETDGNELKRRVEERTGGRFVTREEMKTQYALPGAFKPYIQIAQMKK